jgi:hypothetical protein
MKKQILLSFLLLSILISCNTTTKKTEEKKEPVKTTADVIRENIEAYIQDKLHDPNSYEFIDLSVLDTITYKENIEEFKTSTKLNIETARILKDQSDIKIYNNRLIKLKEIEKSIQDSLNNTAAYLYSFKFRANNKMGALTLHDYYVQLTSEPEYEVLNMTTEFDKLYLEPNGFPRRNELFE